MKITLLHPSRGRAEKARQTHDLWAAKCSGLNEIEHILSIDMDDEQTARFIELFKEFSSTKVIAEKNDSVVMATNRAAKYATGELLIYVSDDFECPDNWDALLAE